ncbi:receptor activity-modifying protein 1 isoform X2 [Pseudorca crassidens]|uniref:receptor activity-modifying protein 1 isoform X2 n=1 Tax=Pseudorca crassidens TaxID=82174 RepID=UPI00352D9625
MARGLRGLPRRGLWLLLVSHLFMATACQDATFSTLLQELCLAQFQVDMEAVGRPLWCDWGKTIGVQGPGASEGSSGRGKAKRNTPQMPRSQAGGRPTRRAGSAECLWVSNLGSDVLCTKTCTSVYSRAQDTQELGAGVLASCPCN